MAETGASSHVVVVQPKPLLRGWFHAGAALASIIFTIVLLFLTADDPPRLVSMLVFGLTMVELYTVSAIYHIGRWQPRTHRVLRSLDHSNIFLLIAGTYTPLCFNVLNGWMRPASLITIWILAFAGVGVAVFALHWPRWVGTSLYFIMGWIAVIVMPAYIEKLGWGPVALLLAGGVLYTAGGVIYALKRPNPFPRVFGFHEIFHLFVIAGSAAFALMITIWVLPFPRS
jgi:hemolysin III